MTDINKQKFLAELGKLLTFMYEEDRQKALSMYSDIFDQADDQQALMNHLISPTRQAVVIARAYNAKERKLQIHSQSRDDDGIYADEDEDAPAFVRAIAENLPYAVFHENEDAVSDDQFSLFYNGQNPVIEKGIQDESVAAEEEPAEAEDAKPSESAEEETLEAPEAEDTVEGEKDAEEGVDEEDEAELSLEKAETAAPVKVMKPRVFLLILYVIFAVPVTAAGIVLLLIPTVLFLFLAAGFIYVGISLLSGAFSGFAVFADIMVVLGIATVVLALGLLFFWIFIWFIGGAMAALVRLGLDLGKKWCYKEVPAV